MASKLHKLLLGGAALYASGIAAQSIQLGSRDCVLGAVSQGTVGLALGSLLQAAGNFAGGWLSNRFHDRYKSLEYELNDPSDVLRNNFLRRLVVRAIQLGVRNAALSAGPDSHVADAIERLAREAAASFEVDARIADRLDLDEPSLERFFTGEWEDFARVRTPSRDEWAAFLAHAASTPGDVFVVRAIDLAAASLAADFSRLLFNSAKLAAENDRPAYAGLELMLIRSLATTLHAHGAALDSLLAAQHRTAEQLTAIRGDLQALKDDLQRVPPRVEARLAMPDLAMLDPALAPQLRTGAVLLARSIPPAVSSLDLRLAAVESLLRTIKAGVDRANAELGAARGDLRELRGLVTGEQEVLPSLPAVGSVIRDHANHEWRIVRLESTSRTGCVAVADHRGRTSVFKVCIIADFARSFVREVEVATLLQASTGPHARFCRILDKKLPAAVQGEPGVATQPPYWIQLDFFPLGSLERYWKPDDLTPQQREHHAAGLTAQVARTVHTAHERQIVHRDLKPSNILMRRDADGHPLPFVADFGVSSFADQAQAEKRRNHATGRTIHSKTVGDHHGEGTLLYMAPELYERSADNRPPADPSPVTDVYALGVMLYWLLTGRSERPESARVRLFVRDPVLGYIVRKATHLDAGKRYASAAEMADDLERRADLLPRAESLAATLLSDADRLDAERARAQAAEQRQRTAEQRVRFARIVTSLLLALFGIAAAASYTVWSSGQKRAAAETRASREFEERRRAIEGQLAAVADPAVRTIPGSQPIRRAILETTLARYQELMAHPRADHAISLHAGLALSHLGLLEQELGNQDKSLAAHHRAVELCRRAHAQLDSPESSDALAEALYQLGQHHLTMQRPADALPAAAEAVTICEKRLAAEPGLRPAWARAVLSVNAASEDTARDPALMERAVAILLEAAAARPDDPELLATCARALGNQVASANTIESAEQSLKAVEYCRRALAADPAMEAAAFRHSRYLRNATFVLTGLGQADQALAATDQAIPVNERFAQENPGVPSAVIALAELHADRARTLNYLNRGAEAVESYRKMIDVLENSPRGRAADPDLISRCAHAYLNIEIILSAAGRNAEAIDNLEAGARLADAAALATPPPDTLLYTQMQLRCRIAQLQAEIPNFEAARQQFQRGVDALARSNRRFEDVHPDVRATYVACAAGLVDTAAKDGQAERALELWEKYIRPIPLDKLSSSNDHQAVLSAYVTASIQLESIGDLRGALAQRIWVRDQAQAIGKDDWYVYQMAFGAHQHVARLAAIANDGPTQFAALRDYFRETQPYVQGREHADLLARTAEYSPANLKLLEDEKNKLGEGGMKRFTIPADFDGVKVPFHVYVAESWEFLNDQFEWVKRVRGGRVPQEVVDSFQRLYNIAKENNVSFQDLCVYALGTVSAAESAKAGRMVAELSQRKSPLMVFAAPDGRPAPAGPERAAPDAIAPTINYIAMLKDLEVLRRQALSGVGGDAAKRELVARYGRLAHDEIARSNLFRAEHLIKNAREIAQRLDPDDRDPRTDPVAAAIEFIAAVQAAIAAPNRQRPYQDLIDLLDGPPLPADFAQPGEREFAVAWTAARLGRSPEAGLWLLRAAEAGHPLAAESLYYACEVEPAVAKLLGSPISTLVVAAQSSATKEAPAANLFSEKLREHLASSPQ